MTHWNGQTRPIDDLEAFVAQYFADWEAAIGLRAERLELERREGVHPSDWLIDLLMLEPERADEA